MTNADFIFVLIIGSLLGITVSKILEFFFMHRLVRTKSWFTFKRKFIGK